jgi:Alw26I/Eco31I/Esp3I family type II restriction m6 adenine DNA methyltransferase
MSSPKPYEEQIEATLLEIVSQIQNEKGEVARLDVLEAVAAELGGWDLAEYRKLFREPHILPIRECRQRASFIKFELEKLPIHSALVLSRLAQPTLSNSDRRQTGAYYTDFRLARYLSRCVAVHVPRGARIIDPACGTGVLLAAIAIELCESGNQSVSKIISESIYGCDMSPSAIRGARLALGSLTSSTVALRKLNMHLRIQDSLMASESDWRVLSRDGFDLVIGNPPWEKLKLGRHEFLKSEGREVHYGSDTAMNTEAVSRLEMGRGALQQKVDELESRYPLAADGEFDLYKAFVELAFRIVSNKGQVALLVPAGLIRSSSTGPLRSQLVSKAKKLSITIFDNRARFFSIDTRFKFLVLHAQLDHQKQCPLQLLHASGTSLGIEITGSASLPITQLRSLGETMMIPEVRSPKEWKLLKHIYLRGIRLSDSVDWKPLLMREVDMTRDKSSFKRNLGNLTGELLAVIEGRMVHQYRLGAKSYSSGTGRQSVWRTNSPGSSEIHPQFWITPTDIPAPARSRIGYARIGFCDITGQTNERTILVCRIPSGVICGNKVPTVVLAATERDTAEDAWIAIANSFVFDWVARRSITTTVNYFLLLGLPFPRITLQSEATRSLAAFSARLAELDRAGPDLQAEVEALRIEIDALVASCYQLSITDLELIFKDFPLLDRSQPPLPGESRSTITRDLVISRFGEITSTPCVDFTQRAHEARALGAKAFIPAQYD